MIAKMIDTIISITMFPKVSPSMIDVPIMRNESMIATIMYTAK